MKLWVTGIEQFVEKNWGVVYYFSKGLRRLSEILSHPSPPPLAKPHKNESPLISTKPFSSIFSHTNISQHHYNYAINNKWIPHPNLWLIYCNHVWRIVVRNLHFWVHLSVHIWVVDFLVELWSLESKDSISDDRSLSWWKMANCFTKKLYYTQDYVNN